MSENQELVMSTFPMDNTEDMYLIVQIDPFTVDGIEYSFHRDGGVYHMPMFSVKLDAPHDQEFCEAKEWRCMNFDAMVATDANLKSENAWAWKDVKWDPTIRL